MLRGEKTIAEARLGVRTQEGMMKTLTKKVAAVAALLALNSIVAAKPVRALEFEWMKCFDELGVKFDCCVICESPFCDCEL